MCVFAWTSEECRVLKSNKTNGTERDRAAQVNLLSLKTSTLRGVLRRGEEKRDQTRQRTHKEEIHKAVCTRDSVS